MNLEWDIYTKIFQKDVNNYIMIDAEGEYESKGAYIKKLSKIDYDLPIVNKALIEYFVHGTPVEETVLACDDLIEFQKIVKVSGLYKYAMHGDKKLSEKVFRVFASTDPDAPGMTKVKSESRIEKVANTPEHLFIDNSDVTEKKCPPELDKSYYVDLAKKRLDDFLSEKPSKSSKLKSEIKYIGYDEKNAIDELDMSDFGTFTDFALYVIREKLLNKKQLSILVKLDKFSEFGNGKELLRILELIDFFKNGEAKTISKEKFENSGLPYDKLADFFEETKTKYKIIDCDDLLNACEDLILQCGISDFSYKEKIASQIEYTGDIYPTGKDEDRPKLYVKEVREIQNQFKGGVWKYKVTAKSLGSGIETAYDVSPTLYKKKSVHESDIVEVVKWDQNLKGYYVLFDYTILT